MWDWLRGNDSGKGHCVQWKIGEPECAPKIQFEQTDIAAIVQAHRG